MKTISLRELHHKTGEWIRQAGKFGEIQVSERGQVIAKILPQAAAPAVPYFARRKLRAQFRRVMGKLNGGTDSTRVISEDRDREIR